jgi:hypothetical protein
VKIIDNPLPPLVPGFARDILSPLSDAEWNQLNEALNDDFREKSFT